MEFFRKSKVLSKLSELEILLNRTMADTYAWETARSNTTMLKAASSIKLNSDKIIALYFELIKLNGSKNIYFTNKCIPPPMPKEVSVLNGIMAIIEIAKDLEEKNVSFKAQLISKQSISTIEEILYF